VTYGLNSAAVPVGPTQPVNKNCASTGIGDKERNADTNGIGHAGLLITVFLLCQLPAWSADRQAKISADICKLESQLDRAIVTHDNNLLPAVLADECQHTNSLGGTTDKKAELDFFASPEFSLTRASIDSCNVRVYAM